MGDPKSSLTVSGGTWAVPEEGVDNSGAVQERKEVGDWGMAS